MREDRTVNGNVNNVNKKPEDGKTAETFCTFPLFGNEAIVYRVPEGKSGDTAYTDGKILECASRFLAEKPFLAEKTEKKGKAPRMTVVRDSFGKPHVRLLPESPEGREDTGTAGTGNIAGAAETEETEKTEEIYVSVTHTPGLALVAVSPFPVGIDAEREEKTVRHPEGLARRYFTEEDVRALEKEGFANGAFLTMWVKKEALSKLVGRGIPCMREKAVAEPGLVFEKLAIPGYTVFAVRKTDTKGKETDTDKDPRTDPEWESERK